MAEDELSLLGRTEPFIVNSRLLGGMPVPVHFVRDSSDLPATEARFYFKQKFLFEFHAFGKQGLAGEQKK